MLPADAGPEEMLAALQAAGEDPFELLEQLLPAPEEILGHLLNYWTPLLRPGTHALDVEVTAAEFLAAMGRLTPDDVELDEIAAAMISDVEAVQTPEAMAMVTALTAVGPPKVRTAAAGVAGKLASAGVAAPGWAAELGRPSVGKCFGYVDAFGEQETVALCFGYGRKQHAIGVLIDHVLGGGIKDCFVAYPARGIRAQYQAAARLTDDLEFRDYSPAEAAAIVLRALECEPCPEQPDQIEDVGSYLGLLRSRVKLLPAAGPGDGVREPPARRPATKGKNATPAAAAPARDATRPMVHRVKVTLRGAKPPIWRRLEIPSDLTLSGLHGCVQQAFGWEGGHLWVFSTPQGEFGRADPGLGHRSASSRTVADVLRASGSRIRYTYDFGDDWEHEILAEEIKPAEPGVAYPRCTAGRRACPPEDCGGIWGYAYLLDILADPAHPEHADRLDWLGLRSATEFDPAAFNLDQANHALKGLAKVLARSQAAQ
jgi:hypothetical protein